MYCKCQLPFAGNQSRINNSDIFTTVIADVPTNGEYYRTEGFYTSVVRVEFPDIDVTGIVGCCVTDGI
jgi:hypothetical protein